jgi:hypothetical protein
LWRISECFELVARFLLSGLCAKKLPGLFLCNLQQFDMLKKQHFEKKTRVGLCDPPSGSLCLTFREMAKSSHEQSARVTILNSNRPKPLADSGLDRQKVTTQESTQRTSDGDQDINMLCGPLWRI